MRTVHPLIQQRPQQRHLQLAEPPQPTITSSSVECTRKNKASHLITSFLLLKEPPLPEGNPTKPDTRSTLESIIIVSPFSSLHELIYTWARDWILTYLLDSNIVATACWDLSALLTCWSYVVSIRRITPLGYRDTSPLAPFMIDSSKITIGKNEARLFFRIWETYKDPNQIHTIQTRTKSKLYIPPNHPALWHGIKRGVKSSKVQHIHWVGRGAGVLSYCFGRGRAW